MGYCLNSTTRINSTIGKKIENIKVEVKRAKDDINNIYLKDEKNYCDKFLMENGEKIIFRAEQAIMNLKEIDYLGLIKRSMKKNEICLGRIDDGNLRVMENIEIATLKNISYNLIEEDIYDYLRRVRRKNNKICIKQIVNEYTKVANLNKCSEDYLNILLNIPYDTLKQWKKYRVNKRNLSSSEYLNNLKIAFSYEIG